MEKGVVVFYFIFFSSLPSRWLRRLQNQYYTPHKTWMTARNRNIAWPSWVVFLIGCEKACADLLGAAAPALQRLVTALLVCMNCQRGLSLVGGAGGLLTPGWERGPSSAKPVISSVFDSRADASDHSEFVWAAGAPHGWTRFTVRKVN